MRYKSQIIRLILALLFKRLKTDRFICPILNRKVIAFTGYCKVFTVGVGSTWGLLQLGLDIEAIIGCAYPSFGFGGRNSAGLLLVNFGF